MQENQGAFLGSLLLASDPLQCGFHLEVADVGCEEPAMALQPADLERQEAYLSCSSIDAWIVELHRTAGVAALTVGERPALLPGLHL